MTARCTLAIAGAFFAYLACAPPGSAQSADTDQREIDRILFSVEMFASVAATAYVGGYGCQIGDPERWKRIFDAIDDRYERCVSPGSALAQAVEKKYATDLPFADKKTLGSLAFEQWLVRRSEQFKKEGAVSACKKSELKELIDGEHPYLWFDAKLVFKLGDDRTWVTAPCDRFFPEDK